jgi:hypothetical protein
MVAGRPVELAAAMLRFTGAELRSRLLHPIRVKKPQRCRIGLAPVPDKLAAVGQ